MHLAYILVPYYNNIENQLIYLLADYKKWNGNPGLKYSDFMTTVEKKNYI